MKTRGSGLLLHITSLPSRFGIGDLGPAAYEFISQLSNAGQQYWQILPLHPTLPKFDNSPYHALSAFAGNPLLISPDIMVSDGFLDFSDIKTIPFFPSDTVEFAFVRDYKEKLFSKAYDRFRQRGGSSGFDAFCTKNASWLDDYALFMTIWKKEHAISWSDWPSAVKRRNAEKLNQIHHSYSYEIEKEQFLQYLFRIQWNALKQCCIRNGIRIIGDIPIYVTFDSADVWTHPNLFKLDSDLHPYVIAGVPPDYFSSTGQLWNNPLYNWEEMKTSRYEWWIQRFLHMLSLVDYLRIDHFRGLVEYWEIPSGSRDAIHGQWQSAPAEDLLHTLSKTCACLPLIAEDLGIITPEIREVMNAYDIPGMKVLIFAFGSDIAKNPYIPYHHTRNSVVYTGTHDNNTILGWYKNDCSPIERDHIQSFLGRAIQPEEIPGIFIRMAMMSIAQTVIIPMQDLLGLDSYARMNQPGTTTGNWKWRIKPDQITPEILINLREMTEIYGRI